MSSHHIVREGQEPALIIANGAACNNELMGQLLEWSPFVLVLDGALERVISLEIKYDVLLGDFDHHNMQELQNLVQPDIKIIHAPDQEKTDLEKGIEYLIEKGFPAVNILWATGKRSDHYMNNIATLARYHDQINQVMLDDHSRIYPIASGFKKYYEKGSNLSLIPLNKVESVFTENLIWNLNGGTLEFPFNTGSSNKVKETGIVSISYSSGNMLLMECID